MSNRNSSENSDSISLFPFLAVLLCTMGALLVLLVILVQRAAEISLLPDATGPQLASVDGPKLVVPKSENGQKQVDAKQTAELEKQLAEVAAYQQKLEEIKAEGEQRLRDEQARMSHLEDHRRRLEEELAKLAIANEQLKQTEQNATVDQDQAEKELARLAELIDEKEKQLEDLKEAPTGKKSYAIVPYKGPNGTFRMPIYLECKGDVVTIHPEGHHLTKNDFVASSWPGNPLAAMLRATREFQNNKARSAGQPEPPDPYPLIIVRPSGLKSYLWARSAITAWDSDYGYEFIDEDMKLSFPIAADPQLAQVQNHALMISRERLLHMVQSAPSRFPGLKMTGGSPHGTGVDGSGAGGGTAGSGYGMSDTSGQGMTGGGNGLASGGGGEEGGFNSIQYGSGDGMSGTGNGMSGGAPAGEQLSGKGVNGQEGPHLGEYHGDPKDAQAGTSGGSVTGAMAQNGTAEGGSAENGTAQGTNGQNGPDLGPRYAQQVSGNGSANNAPSEPIDGSKSNGQMAGGPGGAGGNGAGNSSGGNFGGSAGSGFSSSSQPDSSIANTRGSNWAVNQPRQKSVAIRRTIHVVVRDNQMIMQPSSEARRGTTGKQISLDQSVDTISDEFAAAVKERVDDWGLAGSGMYWRPVLELKVEPGAQMTATRITNLLHDSGVEVQFPTTATNASSPVGGTVR
jgi:biopolymer transport protein ExbD